MSDNLSSSSVNPASCHPTCKPPTFRPRRIIFCQISWIYLATLLLHNRWSRESWSSRCSTTTTPRRIHDPTVPYSHTAYSLARKRLQIRTVPPSVLPGVYIPLTFIAMASALLDLVYSMGSCLSCFPSSPQLKINNRSFKILRLLGEVYCRSTTQLTSLTHILTRAAFPTFTSSKTHPLMTCSP